MSTSVADHVASSPLGKFFSPVKKSTLEVLQNEVASLTEERDFFKSKYTSQMSDIAGLEKELKAARNQIAKLRGELIAVEIEKAKITSACEGGGSASVTRSDTCPSTTGLLSTGNDSISREDEEIQEEDDEGDRPKREITAPQDKSCKSGGDTGSTEGEEIEADDEQSEDEDNNIRDHAAKMLIWANYQEVRAAQSTRRVSSSGDVSVASPSPSIKSLAEQVPRTIHATSPVSAAESARARAQSLLGLTADHDEDDEGSVSDEEVESDYGSENDEGDEDIGTTQSEYLLDSVRKVL
uniref:Uncharacterized protein n=1 Tax=Odontella aurita TaxID=265563 RepID=A0A7S4J0W9_9STRA|mmetsp:Transcript_35195/g.105123  ORF Transcript_35195/g.105123 Transcript_35195/m.105123 type:complete len:296 (+) Transcript_35195:326-1213(+)|eukprot:CAMPEP_0113553634 /NCGR_PEP_ID=MMETSP0015_2-20120614/15720_1 /TAXON_ID=2838 /ORGANISM="Odontella" /LENGTH=295 /DNA_ID=CAMNT_0000454721 /DNA_START=254 /DNA_END=1141 /DNA_ORIENTATION=+ /assembly_acc=CAM_ASM_000160